MSQKANYRYSGTGTAARLAAEAARSAASAARRAENERRSAEWAKRTAEITQEHLQRYQAILDDMRAQGLDEFAKEGIAEVSALIVRARSLIHTDTAAARDISRTIGPLIGPMPRAARQLRAISRASQVGGNVSASTTHPSGTLGNMPVSSPSTSFNADQQQVVTPMEDPVEIAWRDTMAEWTDYLARDLAYAEITSLREKINVPGGLNSPQEVRSIFSELRSKWETEATKQRDDEAVVLALQHQLAEEEPLGPDVPAALNDAELNPADELEEGRREAVRGVINALEDAGFLVENPRLVKDATGTNEVVVVGTRASGASATFNLTLDGTLQYDFSGYKGSSCDADIDAVVPALQDVYGIQLTEEVVAWRNPDDLDAAARPQPGRTKKA